MRQNDFEKIVEALFNNCKEVLTKKTKEYNSNMFDRFAMFKQAGAIQGISQEKALFGMFTKHIVSIYNMCCNIVDGRIVDFNENISVEAFIKLLQEKISDSINYLALLYAMAIDDLEELYYEQDRSKNT